MTDLSFLPTSCFNLCSKVWGEKHTHTHTQRRKNHNLFPLSPRKVRPQNRTLSIPRESCLLSGHVILSLGLNKTNFIYSTCLKPNPKLFNTHGFTPTATLTRLWLKAVLCFSGQLCTNLTNSDPKPVQISSPLIPLLIPLLLCSEDVIGQLGSCLMSWNPDLGLWFFVSDTSPKCPFAVGFILLSVLLVPEGKRIRRSLYTTQVTCCTHIKSLCIKQEMTSKDGCCSKKPSGLAQISVLWIWCRRLADTNQLNQHRGQY